MTFAEAAWMICAFTAIACTGSPPPGAARPVPLARVSSGPQAIAPAPESPEPAPPVVVERTETYMGSKPDGTSLPLNQEQVIEYRRKNGALVKVSDKVVPRQ